MCDSVTDGAQGEREVVNFSRKRLAVSYLRPFVVSAIAGLRQQLATARGELVKPCATP